MKQGLISGEEPDVEVLLEAARQGSLRVFTGLKDAFDKWEHEYTDGEGWWKSDTTDVLFSAFMMMTNKHGMEVEVALDQLASVVSAIQSEYGE